jgi:hypothetical protein
MILKFKRQFFGLYVFTLKRGRSREISFLKKKCGAVTSPLKCVLQFSQQGVVLMSVMNGHIESK